MPSLSIIIPFSGSTAHLITDLSTAVQGADEVIIIDNASDDQTATALREVEQYPGGVYIRNETNTGFAAANNQGYARATGDIVMFLNSDVIGAPGWLGVVKHDVKAGALYGPSLQQQLIAGRWLPYLEGWCIVATHETWLLLADNIEGNQVPCVWDACCYPGPYWEDNDLCLRAVQAGIPLIQTRWAQDRMLAHKGGQTTGPVLHHGASFAANERTFTERVLRAFEGRADAPPTPTWQRYMEHVSTQSDIQHHLPLLYSLARGNVLELGTRTGVSTAALLAGVEAHGGHVWSVDVDDCSGLYLGHPRWTFLQSDSRNPDLPPQINMPIDLLLVDSEHVVDVTAAELALWEPHVGYGGYILLHDIETFPGVRRAISDYCKDRLDLHITFVLPCNGMAIIEKFPQSSLCLNGPVSVVNSADALP